MPETHCEECGIIGEWTLMTDQADEIRFCSEKCRTAWLKTTEAWLDIDQK